MSKPSDHALHFEGVKVAMRQTKDGYAMTVVIHPNDVPPGLFSAPVGQRYMVALVALDDQDQPVVQPRDEGAEAVRYAALLCKEPLFQEWIGMQRGYNDVLGEEEAAELLRLRLGIKSRGELARANPALLAEFNAIASGYRKWAGIE